MANAFIVDLWSGIGGCSHTSECPNGAGNEDDKDESDEDPGGKRDEHDILEASGGQGRMEARVGALAPVRSI